MQAKSSWTPDFAMQRLDSAACVSRRNSALRRMVVKRAKYEATEHLALTAYFALAEEFSIDTLTLPLSQYRWFAMGAMFAVNGRFG
jgi:hypothetical protein